MLFRSDTVTTVFEDGESSYSNEYMANVDASGITLEQVDQVIIYAIAGNIRVENAKDKVEVFTTDGKLIKSVAGNDTYTIGIETGIYLVKSGSTVSKVIVK